MPTDLAAEGWEFVAPMEECQPVGAEEEVLVRLLLLIALQFSSCDLLLVALQFSSSVSDFLSHAPQSFLFFSHNFAQIDDIAISSPWEHHRQASRDRHRQVPCRCASCLAEQISIPKGWAKARMCATRLCCQE